MTGAAQVPRPGRRLAISSSQRDHALAVQAPFESTYATAPCDTVDAMAVEGLAIARPLAERGSTWSQQCRAACAEVSVCERRDRVRPGLRSHLCTASDVHVRVDLAEHVRLRGHSVLTDVSRGPPIHPSVHLGATLSCPLGLVPK